MTVKADNAVHTDPATAPATIPTTTAAPPAHKNEDIRRYNAAARIIMEQNGIEVNDLYQLVEPHISEYISADMIHPTPAGVEALAAAVSHKIKEVSHD